MLWSELLPFEALAQALLSGGNCAYFAVYARRAYPRSRRAAALALTLLSAALSLEAAVFVFVSLGGATGALAGSAAAFLVRGLLLAATAFLSLLVWRRRQG